MQERVAKIVDFSETISRETYPENCLPSITQDKVSCTNSSHSQEGTIVYKQVTLFILQQIKFYYTNKDIMSV